jgi:outer membrane lipoprotein LolB
MGRFLFLLASVFLLASCSTAPVRGDWSMREWPAEWSLRRAALQNLQGFELGGRLAVARGDSGGSAALRWQQRGEESTVEIEGPMGLAANRFRYRPGDEAAWRQLETQLGFALPAGSFRYWLLGVPDPASPAEEQVLADDPPAPERGDARTVLRSLQQSGWQIEFVDYAELSRAGLRLPARIEARSQDENGESIRVRVLIQRWARLP